MTERRVVEKAKTGSTNDDLKALAAEGAASGTMVLARAQSAGRGRVGRSWFSPGVGNLYASYLHRSGLEASALASMTLEVGLAVAEVLEAAGVDVALKWPNDLMLGDRKVGGVLCELLLIDEGGAPSVVAGVGLNLVTPEGGFPAEIADIATSVQAETGVTLEAAEVARALGRRLDRSLAAYERRGRPDIARFDVWLYGRGRLVSFEAAGGRRQGRIEGVGADGALLVRVGADHVSVRSGLVELLDSEGQGRG